MTQGTSRSHIHNTEKDHLLRFIAGMKSAGLQVTGPRLAICQTLAEMLGQSHPSVRDIHEAVQHRLPKVSLATVYNTLTALTGLGLVYPLGDGGDGAERYELNPIPHVNLLCIRCQRISDAPGVSIAGLQEQVTAHTGFTVLGGRMLYYGTCSECAQTATE